MIMATRPAADSRGPAARRPRSARTATTCSASATPPGRADQATGNIKQAGAKIKDASGH